MRVGDKVGRLLRDCRTKGGGRKEEDKYGGKPKSSRHLEGLILLVFDIRLIESEIEREMKTANGDKISLRLEDKGLGGQSGKLEEDRHVESEVGG
jgi:hypothetical protein